MLDLQYTLKVSVCPNFLQPISTRDSGGCCLFIYVEPYPYLSSNTEQEFFAQWTNVDALHIVRLKNPNISRHSVSMQYILSSSPCDVLSLTFKLLNLVKQWQQHSQLLWGHRWVTALLMPTKNKHCPFTNHKRILPLKRNLKSNLARH